MSIPTLRDVLVCVWVLNRNYLPGLFDFVYFNCIMLRSTLLKPLAVELRYNDDIGLCGLTRIGASVPLGHALNANL